MRTELATRLGLALSLAVAVGASTAQAHGPSVSRRLLLEPRSEGWVALLQLDLRGRDRVRALGMALSRTSSAALTAALVPRVLDGVRLSDAAGPIALVVADAAAQTSAERVELMVLLELGARGREGLRVALEEKAAGLALTVLGAGSDHLHAGESRQIPAPTAASEAERLIPLDGAAVGN